MHTCITDLPSCPFHSLPVLEHHVTQRPDLLLHCYLGLSSTAVWCWLIMLIPRETERSLFFVVFFLFFFFFGNFTK